MLLDSGNCHSIVSSAQAWMTCCVIAWFAGSQPIAAKIACREEEAHIQVSIGNSPSLGANAIIYKSHLPHPCTLFTLLAILALYNLNQPIVTDVEVSTRPLIANSKLRNAMPVRRSGSMLFMVTVAVMGLLLSPTTVYSVSLWTSSSSSGSTLSST